MILCQGKQHPYFFIIDAKVFIQEIKFSRKAEVVTGFKESVNRLVITQQNREKFANKLLALSKVDLQERKVLID